jgi:glycosyltransferase involved in cell wall biosynthesis
VRRLKVLFITNWYPTREEPVKAPWVREHAKAVRLYDDVAVLHCAGCDPKLKRLWRMGSETDGGLSEGISTYRIWYRSLPVPGASYFIYVWSIFRAFGHLVADGSVPDVIHVHVYDAGWPAILLGQWHHIPVVVTEHFSSFPRRLLGCLDVCKAWLAFRWADRVLPVSRCLQKAIEHYGIRARFQVISNVVDTALFCPDASVQRDTKSKRLLFVGQLVPVRGVSYLLKALSCLSRKRSDWHLDIVGDGAARTEYEQLAVDLKLCERVAFHGFKTRTEVAQFMSRADLFVVASLSETFSVPAAEALASGTPVIATRCGGPEEFVSTDVGLLVPPADAAALCEGLDYMLDRLHLYSRQGISQHARERFSAERVGAQLHAVYQSVSVAVK